ncbi:hypothetical protein EJ05DRAFT_497675 [Pseudovirgaria hyperparasitica]|uniref:Zn(2)-C6 fungal-type domain-containing protein n=1 Tax=Pseudovirgaria hyperparasitica TaxID=470096 RepID=A0A6A6WGM5_9PEZI|nr:uncharacterized protein EJ05DRAFT_497675 [Pseudovirgaria hyperparasitica]KAF2761116.1 hypothetical protein EJ05DRAFT_497675 [Pseudovirgaria hyperparasitica]
MPTRESLTANGKPRKRATEACTTCRRRKIKCDGAQPNCVNCKTFNRICSYEPIEEEVRRQQKPRKRVRRGTTSDASPTSSLIGNEGDQQTTVPARDTQRNVSTIVFSANGTSSYHGQTSALFEELHSEPLLQARPIPRISEAWAEKGLVAEAAKQRQMEDVNFAAGTLDFDGVDPDLGMHLLSLHWNRQHHSFLITYRPVFMRDMACQGPYFSRILLNAIYFGAAKFSPRLEVRKDPNDVRTAGWQFRERVRELLGSALDKSEITTIQALLVMTNSLFALGDERSAAWLYAGLAFRMIIDLGMHVDAPDILSVRKLSEEDIEVRRRVFWGAFVVDKIQSLYHGRPVTFQGQDARVPIKFLDTFEELERWKPFAYTPQIEQYGGCPAFSVSTFSHLCKLSVILGDILTSIYAENSSERTPDELSRLLEELNGKLVQWRNSIPKHMEFDHTKPTLSDPPPHIFSLLIMHQVLVILLHRPFVADGHLYRNARSVPANAFAACATAATQIVHLLRAYDKAFSIRKAPYLISYACYVSATIHARIVAQRGRLSEAYSSVETCLAVFEENQETNWAVKRANIIIQNLLKKLGSTLPQRPWKISSNANIPNSSGDTDPPPATAPLSLADSSAVEQPSPTSSLDLDAIIQSFAPDQDLSQSEFTIRTDHPISGDFYPPQGQSGSYNSAYPLQMAYNPYNSDPNIDDLLFGFNSSTLDNFSFPDWTGT